MKNVSFVIIVFASLVLTACATAPTQSLSSQENLFNNQLDSSYILKQARAVYQQWDTGKNIHHLTKAYQLFQQGLVLRPDDLNFQHGFYMSGFTLALMQQLPLRTVSSNFDALHPILKKQLPSPSRLKYIEAKRKKLAATDIYEILRLSLQDEPKDDYLWKSLSLEAEKKKLPWLSAALAHQAFTINSSNVNYLIQSSDMLSLVYAQSLCGKKQVKLQQKILKLYLQAEKLAPKNASVQSKISFNYARVGLMPLAIKYAKQAYAIEANAWNTYAYAYALFYNHRYDAAKDIGQLLLNGLNPQYGLEVLTVIELALGNLTQAADYARQYAGNNDNTLEHLARNWTISLSDPSYTLAKIANIKPSKLVTSDIINHLKFGQGDVLEPNDNASTCERSVIDFANAVQFWHAGDKARAAEYFKRVKALRHTVHADYDTSQASLQGLSF